MDFSSVLPKLLYIQVSVQANLLAGYAGTKTGQYDDRYAFVHGFQFSAPETTLHSGFSAG
jgi:nitrogen fixation-related uncharacterized protein